MLALLASSLAACGPSLALEDDLFPDTGRRPADDDGNVLHGPYATGSRFGLRIEGTSDGECAGLRIESGDAAVLQVAADGDDPCRAQVTASTPGTATVRVRDADGDAVGSARLEVADAARATLHPRGMFRASLPEADTDWTNAAVVVGQTASFTVRWFDADGRELGAHGVLVASAGDELALGPPPGRAGNGDALQVTPRVAGTHRAEVGVGGAPLSWIDVEGVPVEEVASLDLVRGETRGDDDDRSILLALGRDAYGEPVLGLQPRWTVDDAPMRDDDGAIVEGDLFLFDAGDTEQHVVAEAQGLDATSDVSLRGTPSVESSNGCGAAPGLPGPTNAAVLVLAGLLARTVRRRLRHRLT